jgi:cell division protease FtsH
MLWKRIKILYLQNQFWFIVVLVCVVLGVLSIVGLAYKDSFFAQQQIATLPLETLKMMLWGLTSAYFFMQIMYKGGGNFSSIGSGGKVKGENIKVTFKDVIGLTEAKREAMEVVSLIKDRAKVRRIGGKVVRGLLMVGPPGCGKTYMAKAMAHEAGVPFYSIAGSEFVEVFVGVGASRVRKIFEIAKNAAYINGAAIIFIDELDVVGQQRQFSLGGGGQETNSTLNQLLVCMDGLGKEEGANVIVIGATNANIDILDPALLRPGRFDRHIQISMPRARDRQELFEYYLKKVKADPTIDIPRLARKTVWKSPADVENIVKESALISIRNGREMITYKDISEALERIDLGQETHLELTLQERERVAYHEAGHLLVLYQQHPTDDVFKASIKTRGGALGVVYHHPREELYTKTKDELFANVKTALAGYVSEKIKYNVTSTGVSGDFANAMSVASSMVWHYGMSSNGFVGDYTMLLGDIKRGESRISESMKDHLNTEVQTILHRATEEVEAFLRSEWAMMDVFVKALLEKSELDYDEIEAIFKEHGKERIKA